MKKLTSSIIAATIAITMVGSTIHSYVTSSESTIYAADVDLSTKPIAFRESWEGSCTDSNNNTYNDITFVAFVYTDKTVEIKAQKSNSGNSYINFGDIWFDDAIYNTTLVDKNNKVYSDYRTYNSNFSAIQKYTSDKIGYNISTYATRGIDFDFFITPKSYFECETTISVFGHDIIINEGGLSSKIDYYNYYFMQQEYDRICKENSIMQDKYNNDIISLYQLNLVNHPTDYNELIHLYTIYDENLNDKEIGSIDAVCTPDKCTITVNVDNRYNIRDIFDSYDFKLKSINMDMNDYIYFRDIYLFTSTTYYHNNMINELFNMTINNYDTEYCTERLYDMIYDYFYANNSYMVESSLTIEITQKDTEDFPAGFRFITIFNDCTDFSIASLPIGYNPNPLPGTSNNEYIKQLEDKIKTLETENEQLKEKINPDSILNFDTNNDGYVDAIDASTILAIYALNSTGKNIKTMQEYYDYCASHK